MGGQNFDEFSHFAAKNVPAFADVAIQRERFVLRENVDAAQIGVEAVGKSDVDDAVNSAEGHGGFGAVARERIKALTGASCKKNSESVFHA